MTEQEKQEILAELEKRIDEKYKISPVKEDTQGVLKEPRDKWFKNAETGAYQGSIMHKLFGAVIYWQVWELIRKLTCLICGRQYVRHLAHIPEADEIAEALCQAVYALKLKYNEEMEKSE